MAERAVAIPSQGAGRRVALLTLGSTLNQADSQRIARELGAGIEAIHRPAVADAYIINTCPVTHGAERTARRLTHVASAAPIVVAGFYMGRGATQPVCKIMLARDRRVLRGATVPPRIVDVRARELVGEAA